MLSDADPLPDAVLEQQRRLWLDGQEPDIEDVLLDSGYQLDREALLDLLYNEIVVKEELGLQPSLDEYVRRYPELEPDLKLHFEVHQALNEQLLLETASPREERSWPQSRSGTQPENLPQDDYDIQRLIGQGGVAAVYQARHRRLRRDVALKLFQPGRMLTPREVIRIRTEAAAMARLTHSNIVQIFEIGENQGAPFLALELAKGGTLADKLQQSPMTSAVAASLIETLARAVQHAHERDVIHRDLKPANILFTQDGVPKITDFGLAKVLEDRDELLTDVTRTGETMGTPRYMAPEQAAGQHERVGPATDVYALGTILYECLTGRVPFVSPHVMDTLHQIREDDPLPPRRLQPPIPRDLETICLHCLEKEPTRRYATAQELADDLRRFQQHEPIRIRPAPVWEYGWRWCRKKPAHAALIALGFLFSAGSLFAAAAARNREHTRLSGLRQDVAQLMKQGRTALDRDELELAQARFQEAWQKVQGEPSLSDHETSVTGWLDHSRNARNRYYWKQRVPPRDFDSRRDEALLLSLLRLPHLSDPIESARDAIRSALELTPVNDFDWQLEREQLVLLDAEMIARESGARAALAFLDATAEFDSRLFHLQRADLLQYLQRDAEAAQARAAAEQHPPRAIATRLRTGMDLVRGGRLPEALAEFEVILSQEPEHFAARLFQSVCFLQLNRHREAIVALTACIAQRPRFHWNHFLLGQARLACGESTEAIREFQTALEGRPSEFVRISTLAQLDLARGQQHRGLRTNRDSGSEIPDNSISKSP